MLIILTKRYSPLPGHNSSSCGGFWPLFKAFLPFGKKHLLFMLFLIILGRLKKASIQTELMSQPHFRIQGGYPEWIYTGGARAGQDFLVINLNIPVYYIISCVGRTTFKCFFLCYFFVAKSMSFYFSFAIVCISNLQ